MIKTDEELREEHQQDVDKAQSDRMERLERLLQSHIEAAAKGREKLNDLMTIRANGQGVLWVLGMLAGAGMALYADRIKALLTAFFRPDIRP